MDNIENVIGGSTNKSTGFLAYVFKFDDEHKAILTNIIQYTIMSIIPILILLRVTRQFVPEADDTKGSVEISIEVLFQLIFIVLAIWYINRIIEYFPTWSKMPYKEFNHINFIISFVFILLTLQTKLGDKIRILTDRVEQLWYGEKPQNKNNGIKVKQPIAHQASRADIIGQIPMAHMPPSHVQMGDNGMIDPSQFIGSTVPGVIEPMAANEGIGGFSGFSGFS